MSLDALDRIGPRTIAFALWCTDMVALATALAVSLLLRFEMLPLSEIYSRHIVHHQMSLIVAAVVFTLAFSWFRLYRYAWRFASLETVRSVVYANTVGVVGLVTIEAMANGVILPKSVLIMFWMISVAMTGGVRILMRMLSVNVKRRNARCRTRAGSVRCPRRAVILGAGATGARVLKSICEDPQLEYDIIGFLDDNPHKHGIYINNVKVLGSIDELHRLVNDRELDEVIVALPESCAARIKPYVMMCRSNQLPVKVVPQIQESLCGKMPLQLTDFSVEDLLKRPPAVVNIAEIGGYISGKRVLVTGAGGSIGSELCRQVASLGPASLVLFGHGENSIHQIFMELKNTYPCLIDRVHCVVGSTANEHCVEETFRFHKPQIVFHAAAHKHVPMMESNEGEAVRNNVLGTKHLADSCGRCGVERIVLISSDKAADPCSIMGATKWLCEELLRASSTVWRNTSFVTVRFGNVLGSRGSVVPIFIDQVKRGGPVTVTHPDMMRYFMTIPEAVRLVLQAGAMGESGEIYLLDMGDLVNISQLAEDTIRLCGLQPRKDIKIEYTGIRPGERLCEQLTSEDESIEETAWDGISLIRRPQYLDHSQMLDALDQLRQVSTSGTSMDVRAMLQSIVPGFCRTRSPEEREDSEIGMKFRI